MTEEEVLRAANVLKEAYKQGHNDGLKEGYNDGYGVGYNDGWVEAEWRYVDRSQLN